MKYIIINGSPHKGNTWEVLKIARQQIRISDADSEFEEIHLINMQLPFCLGCSNCFRKGGKSCPHYKTMSVILEKMNGADGLIFVTTTFNIRETGLAKNLFDHMSYLLHRPYFFNKKAFIITTTGGVGGGSTIKSVAGTLKGIGYNKCYGLSVTSYSWNAYMPSNKTILKTQKIAKKFCDDVKSRKLHFPSTGVLIPYNLFRGMCTIYAPGTEFETEDGMYWTEKERTSKIYDKQIPLLLHQRLIGWIFYIIGKVLGKKMIITYKKDLEKDKNII